ncbi:MAG: PadR family transcriptional regulator [Vicinamibacterales bacterium]
MAHRANGGDLYSGLIRLHILHHAAEERIFGLGIMEELARHGYRISPGTLYPLLHALEKQGYLRGKDERGIRGARRTYQATARGQQALAAAKAKVWELFSELFEPAEMKQGGT